MMIDEPLLCIWVIYDHPRDFPNHVVMRQQWAMRSGEVRAARVGGLYDSVVEARADLPLGLAHLMRHPDDDPAIVETWI
ncbi:MAG TPA: hypothetical protein VFO41_08835 [Alphaproteobacteria bacterium]|nr:hypothetical protein [Alphaproteobacteria bacterium]